ncbi:branched-chain-amino-acid transaminase [Blastopirellula sp. JC732]|uniref:Branched-chain-amino-acid aminotransferase n=1 Tax=Blastopirellula sediminis TaxID=2894196 RepID=A0A9X1MSU1_9BACT|nr:branched-chain-amino-acid transaminase [Blastopirellula sediminis]MCC9604490.1 branched-chain-amino-acid transaminase [Blastopirellula sediminis]MCC9632211.1 branched-chain-amino-acid transaminase [Blastopirellula sediminis]
MSSQQIYINGKFYSKEEAVVSVFDHGLLYGDGVFEGLRVYEGKVFRMEQHLKRLYDSAKAILLDIPMPIEAMAEAVEESVEKNGLANCYIRLVITRGAGTLGLGPERTSNPQVIIIVDKISLYPEEFYQNGLEIVTASTIRNHPGALSPRIKSLNYLNNIMAKCEASKAGCLEALMLNHKGEVSECTADNIFIVKNGQLMTPPTDAGILEGVTREAVLEIAVKAGIPTAEKTLTRHDVYVADECFMTGTAAEVIAVVRIDSRPIGDGRPGPITVKLQELFHKLARS